MGSKTRAVYVRAAEADSYWVRFTVGTTTATILIDFIQDKSFDYYYESVSNTLTR